MSLMDDIIEIGVLQKKVADDTRYKCTCALIQHERLDFHTAVEKLNLSPTETERVRNLLAASNHQTVNRFYADKFKQLLGNLEDEYNRQVKLAESFQKQLTDLRMNDEIQSLQAEIADLMNRSLLILSPREKEDLDMFRKQHWEQCETTSFRYEIGGGGFATFISVICPICGATADITDIDSW